MSHYKKLVDIVVVDDDASREPVYRSLVEHFNFEKKGLWEASLHFCSNLAAFNGYRPNVAAHRLAILDMVLDGSWSAGDSELLDRTIFEQDFAVIAISGKISQERALSRVNRILDLAKARSEFVQIASWDEVYNPISHEISPSQFIFLMSAVLASKSNVDMTLQRGPHESLFLLHLTDMHFGKIEWSAGKLALLQAALLSNSYEPADFVVISGDVANSCSPDQYDEAIQYCQALLHLGVAKSMSGGTLPSCQFFACPGNHDFSRPIALAANIVSGEGSAAQYTLADSATPENLWTQGLAWNPYIDFVSRLTGRSQRDLIDKGYVINTRFQHLGLIVVELCVEQFAIDGYKPGTSIESLNKQLNQLTLELRSIRRGFELLLVVAHRHDSDWWHDLATTLSPSIKSWTLAGPVIYLCGHNHGTPIFRPIDGIDGAMLCEGLPPEHARRGAGRNVPKELAPSVRILELTRRDGNVTGIQSSMLTQIGSEWTTYETERPFTWTGSMWQKREASPTE